MERFLLHKMQTAWLEYAKTIFTAVQFGHRCDALVMPPIDGSLRWPGFIGRDYHKAKVKMLFVGREHNANPDKWDDRHGLGNLERMVKPWLAGETNDETFFQQYATAYGEALSGWGPWQKVFGVLARRAGLTEHEVAYTNLSKCWKWNGNATVHMRRCGQDFPLDDLIAVIRPDLVMILAKPDTLARYVNGTPRISAAHLHCDSAPHFNLRTEQLQDALTWVDARLRRGVRA